VPRVTRPCTGPVGQCGRRLVIVLPFKLISGTVGSVRAVPVRVWVAGGAWLLAVGLGVALWREIREICSA